MQGKRVTLQRQMNSWSTSIENSVGFLANQALSGLLSFLTRTGTLVGCTIQPHRVHCEEPFSKLANTSLLQLGQFNLTPRTRRESIPYQSTFWINNMSRNEAALAILLQVRFFGMPSRNRCFRPCMPLSWLLFHILGMVFPRYFCWGLSCIRLVFHIGRIQYPGRHRRPFGSMLSSMSLAVLFCLFRIVNSSSSGASWH